MKIAILPRMDTYISQDAPSGISVFVYNLASGLAGRREVEAVTVIGTGENCFQDKKIKFVSLIPGSFDTFIEDTIKSYGISKGQGTRSKLLFNLGLSGLKYVVENRYDVIHDSSALPLVTGMGNIIDSRIVTTIHTKLETANIVIPWKLNIYSNIKENQRFVFVSQYQEKKITASLDKIHSAGYIYNGIDVGRYPFMKDANEGNMLWLGRIGMTDDKGARQAIEISGRSSRKLNIVGTISEYDYFINNIKINIDDETIFYRDGNLKTAEKAEYYGRSKLFLFPIQWEEPFGLVMVESMACGTPVVAFARGAVPEIVKDGQTGYIVNPSDSDIRGDFIVKKTGIEGMQDAVERIYDMGSTEYTQMRINCRKHVEDKFTIGRMVDEYVNLYTKMV